MKRCSATFLALFIIAVLTATLSFAFVPEGTQRFHGSVTSAQEQIWSNEDHEMITISGFPDHFSSFYHYDKTPHKELLSNSNKARNQLTAVFLAAYPRPALSSCSRQLQQFYTYGFTTDFAVAHLGETSHNTHTFIGKETDSATGLMYFGARFYDPVIGRFISEDPYGGDINEPKSLARYVYGFNNPLIYIDPDGFAAYKLGTMDPPIKPDPGAGIHGSKRNFWTIYNSEGMGTKGALYCAAGLVYSNWPNASRHLTHYLDNTGNDYEINMSDFMRIKNAADALDKELEMAMEFVETLPVGKHNITSGKTTEQYIEIDKSEDWYYAMAGYLVWGKGKAENLGNNVFNLQFEYKIFDRYNWDKGKVAFFDLPFGKSIEITDEFMGDLHLLGIAREYNLVGSSKRMIKWEVKSKNNRKVLLELNHW